MNIVINGLTLVDDRVSSIEEISSDVTYYLEDTTSLMGYRTFDAYNEPLKAAHSAVYHGSLHLTPEGAASFVNARYIDVAKTPLENTGEYSRESAIPKD